VNNCSLVIAQRRVGTDVDAVIKALEGLNVSALPTESAELLKNEFVADEEDVSRNRIQYGRSWDD